MAKIKPFKGLRYTEKAGGIKNLCCPPYDIVSGEQRQNLIEKNEYNIIRLELPALEANEDFTPYREAAETLRSWLSEGILKRDEKNPCIFYKMIFTYNAKVIREKGFVAW